ncbi:MAG: hypothetical protein ACQESR_18905 [Planctomycetota bacterium]
MESGPTQAILPLVGLAAEKVIRDRYNNGSLNAIVPSGFPATTWPRPFSSRHAVSCHLPRQLQSY